MMEMSLRRNQAQGSLEMAIALICVFILLFASLNLFIWVNERLILRHQAYEDTRVAAGSVAQTNLPIEIQVDESGFPQLDILGENNGG